MQICNPVQSLEGQDVIIIGGGPSLRGFDWELLNGRNTIGCNSAFRLGLRYCNRLFFTDLKFFEAFSTELAEYRGPIYTNCEALQNVSWLNVFPRKPKGLHKDAIGFNYSSGAGAINLALILGARRVFLLGFDCFCTTPAQPNWHDYVIQKLDVGAYSNFILGFQSVAKTLSVFPGCEVYNVSDVSALKVFPTISTYDFFTANDNKYNTI